MHARPRTKAISSNLVLGRLASCDIRIYRTRWGGTRYESYDRTVRVLAIIIDKFVSGPFNLTVSEVSGKYDTEIVPASYTFLIWNLIYLWQTAWVVYTVVALYRKNADG